jgi:DNA replication protein DnaC
MAAELAGFSDQLQEKARSESSLFVYGPRGTGKTHYACACIWEIAKTKDPNDIFTKPPAIFLPVPELMLQFKQSYNQGASETESDVLERYSRIETLVLDDLGAERVSEWSIQMLYLLIDRRYRGVKRTIVTTNLALGEIATKLDDRISSRLAEMCVQVKFEGQDLRLRRAK